MYYIVSPKVKPKMRTVRWVLIAHFVLGLLLLNRIAASADLATSLPYVIPTSSNADLSGLEVSLAEAKATQAELQAKIKQIEKDIAVLAKKLNVPFQATEAPKVAAAPQQGQVPAFYSTSLPPNVISDINCRPKLALFTPSRPPKLTDPNVISPKTNKDPLGTNDVTPETDKLPKNPKFEYAPQYAYLDVPAAIGPPGQRYPTGGWFNGNFYCNQLNNFTRLVFENLSAGFNESYTNIAGSTIESCLS
jgi:hypothetical protein